MRLCLNAFPGKGTVQINSKYHLVPHILQQVTRNAIGSVAQLAERFVNKYCTEKVLGSSPGGIILFFCFFTVFSNFSFYQFFFILFIQFFKWGFHHVHHRFLFFSISICLFYLIFIQFIFSSLPNKDTTLTHSGNSFYLLCPQLPSTYVLSCLPVITVLS